RDHLVGRDLLGELAGGLGRERLAVRGEGEGVLVLARDLPLLGHLLGGDAHAVGDGDVLVAREHLRAERDLVAHHRHHRHRLGAAGQHQVGVAEPDLVGRQRHGLQAGGAEAVDGLRGDGVRQAGQQHADAGHVHALFALGHRAADDGVVDAAGIDARRLRDHGLEHVGEHLVGTGVAEDALRSLADRGPGGGDDVGVLDLLAHSLVSCVVVGQLRSGLPVLSMWAMRAWVLSCWASSTKCLRSRRSSQSSSTTAPRSTSPPHSTVAMRVAISSSYSLMKRPTSMFTSSMRTVAMPTPPETRMRRAGRGGPYPVSASTRASSLAMCSSSKALNTPLSAGRIRPSSRASTAEVETLAMATVSKVFFSSANTSPPGPAACEARTAISFSPPPAGSRPTPASTRPM